MKYSFLDIQAFASSLYGGQRLTLVPYAYTVTFLALAQATQATQQLAITANADFILVGFKHRAQIGAAQVIQTKTAPFVRLLVTDSGSNQQFTNSAIDLENYSENGWGDKELPFPRFIQGRTALTIQATNYAPTAETYTSLDVVLNGVLVYKMG